MRIRTIGAVTAITLAAAVFAPGCGDDSNSTTPTATTAAPTRIPTVATPPTARTAAPTVTPTVAATATATTRPTTTGVASVDAAIRAVLANDAAALTSQFAYFKVNCSANPSGGIPQPPKCEAGEADGAPVEVFLQLYGEGAFRRADDTASVLSQWLSPGMTLYAVIERTTADPSLGSGVPPTEYQYIVVFATTGGAGNSLRLSTRGVTGIDFDLSHNPPQAAELPRMAHYLIAPP